MKKLSLTILSLLLLLSAWGSEKALIDKPIVDKRVELVTIVFRLAGNKEYNKNILKEYTKRIEDHFGQFRDHEVVAFAKKLYKEKSISYDAPVSLAITLDNRLNPVVEYSDNTFLRWSEDDAREFIRLLKKFSQDTKSDKFFRESKNLYDKIENRFTEVYKSLDLDWYSNFYGEKPGEKFTIAIVPGIGVNNYGPSFINSKGEKMVYAVMGVWKADSLDGPIFNIQKYLSTIIHEFNHSFINHLNAQKWDLLKANGDIILEVMNEEMSRMAYDKPEIVLNEALVRAAAIKYFKDHNATESEIDRMIREEYNRGFLWIKELVAELDKYDSMRDQYPTLATYIPCIAKAYSDFAQKVKKFDDKRPRISSIREFKSGDKSVNHSLNKITIEFDRPLAGEGYSINIGEKGLEAFPKVSKIYYSDDKKSVIMEVSLDPGKEYQFVLTGNNFKTPEGYPLKKQTISFKTQ
jgi:6-pyruvoyl-tetrahydropterin synthase